MNLPNALSVLRIILSPVFFGVFLAHQRYVEASAMVVVLWALFAIIEISDLLDG